MQSTATELIRRKREETAGPLPILSLLSRYPGQAALAAVTGLLVGGLGWAVSLFVRSVVDHTRDLPMLQLLALGMVFVLFLRAGISLVRRSLQVRIARRIETELSDRYLDHVTRLELRFYEKYHNGDLLNRLNGLEVLRNAVEDRFMGILFDAVLVVLAAVVMLRLDVGIALLATAGAVLPALVIVILRRVIRNSFEEIRRLGSDYSNHCMDALLGVRDLRLTEGEGWILGRIRASFRAFQDFRIGQIMRLTVLSAGTILISSLTGIAILLLGARRVAQGTLSQGDLMFLFTMSGTMLGPLEQLASTWISFDEASVAHSRFAEILALPAEPRPVPPPPPSPLQGHLRLEKVSFGYRAGHPILCDLDLDVPPGSSVGVVGESGAGKSTLLALFAGLYLPDQGVVRVDGVDVRELGLPRLRAATGVVFQTPHLFAANVDENIRMGRWSASREEVEEAARLARADVFIDRLPDRYQTRVSHAGSNFSGGQIQRIALARALICRPQILLLDEATGALDAHTESAIWATLTDSAWRCTRLFITHRLSTTARMDRVVVLDRGRIVEAGTFDSLLANDGPFRKLWKRQMPEESRRSPDPRRVG